MEGFFYLNIVQKTARTIAKTEFASKAINDHANLSAFKEKPSVRISSGMVMIGISYIICWPAIGLLGFLSFYWQKPLIIFIGGPFFYVLAHLVFLTGMYLAGGKYTMVFLRWATRVTLEKLM